MRYIELHQRDTGEEVLIDPAKIEAVKKSTIYFANYVTNYCIEVRETYREIHSLMLKCGAEIHTIRDYKERSAGSDTTRHQSGIYQNESRRQKLPKDSGRA